MSKSDAIQENHLPLLGQETEFLLTNRVQTEKILDQQSFRDKDTKPVILKAFKKLLTIITTHILSKYLCRYIFLTILYCDCNSLLILFHQQYWKLFLMVTRIW